MLFDDMRAIQHKYGYLPAEQIQALAKAPADIPLYQINGVAEFYPEFRVSPPAQAVVEVCTDMACHLRGAETLFAELEQRFAKLGKRAVEIHRRSCLGQCDSAPALTLERNRVPEHHRGTGRESHSGQTRRYRFACSRF